MPCDVMIYPAYSDRSDLMKSCLHCGISITGEGLRYVELQRQGTSIWCSSRVKVYLSKKAICTESVADVDFLYAALKKLKRKIGRFGRIRAAFGIPMRDSYACFLDFPGDMIFDDVKKSLRWRLEEHFPFPAKTLTTMRRKWVFPMVAIYMIKDRLRSILLWHPANHL